MAANVISDKEQSFYLDSSRKNTSQEVTLSVWFNLPPATSSASDYLALLTRQWAYGLYIKKDTQNKYQLVCFDFNKGDVLHSNHELPATATSPYHAVFTINGTHAALYLNGIIQKTITFRYITSTDKLISGHLITIILPTKPAPKKVCSITQALSSEPRSSTAACWPVK